MEIVYYLRAEIKQHLHKLRYILRDSFRCYKMISEEINFMRVLFLKDIPSIGETGEVKEVSDGYARNFLLPRKLAAAATEKALREFKEQKAKLEKMSVEELARVQSVAEKLDGMELEIHVKVSDEGKLYGSVGQQKIAQSLERIGIKIKKSQIFLPGGPVKEIGTYGAIIKFDHGIEAEIKLNVVES